MKDLTSPLPTVFVQRNGIPISIGYLKGGTTYIPLRKVAEALGYTVKWDPIESTVNLTGTPKN